MSHDESGHHVDSHNPYRVPPPTSKAKLSPTASHFPRTKSLVASAVSHYLRKKSLSARAIGFRVKANCSACAAPDRYIVHYHELYPKFLSQVDVSCDVLGESDLVQETASEMSKYMVHETSITTDSGYHSPHPTGPAHLDVSRGYMGAGFANPEVHCPFSRGESLVSLPGEMGETYPQYCVRKQATQRLKYQDRCCLQHPLQG